MNSVTRILCAITTFTITGCASTGKPVTHNLVEVPKWFHTPVTNKVTGFIGASATYNANGQSALATSKQHALQNLANYYGLSLSEQDIQSLDTSQSQSLQLSSGQQVQFLESFSHQGVLYSYASTSNAAKPLNRLNNKQAPIACQFSACQPAWLCDENNQTITGVSFYTVAPSQQLSVAYDNANIIASLLKQSQVNADEFFYERSSQNLAGNQPQSSYARSAEVTATQDINTQLLLTHSCFAGNTFVGNFKHQRYTAKLKSGWKESPIYKGRSISQGQFGANQTMSSDLLLSSAIELAIKDALIELAKVKGITIDNATKVSFDNGYYFLSSSHMKVNEKVSGHLVDISLAYDKGLPVVNAWLLEVL